MEFDGDGGWDCTRPSGFYKDAGDYNPAVFVCDRWVKVKATDSHEDGAYEYEGTLDSIFGAMYDDVTIAAEAAEGDE